MEQAADGDLLAIGRVGDANLLGQQRREAGDVRDVRKGVEVMPQHVEHLVRNHGSIAEQFIDLLRQVFRHRHGAVAVDHLKRRVDFQGERSL